MQELTQAESRRIFGGEDETQCTPATSVNDYYGIQDTTSLGEDLINIYEGVVMATSHVIERVVESFE